MQAIDPAIARRELQRQQHAAADRHCLGQMQRACAPLRSGSDVAGSIRPSTWAPSPDQSAITSASAFVSGWPRWQLAPAASPSLHAGGRGRPAAASSGSAANIATHRRRADDVARCQPGGKAPARSRRDRFDSREPLLWRSASGSCSERPARDGKLKHATGSNPAA